MAKAKSSKPKSYSIRESGRAKHVSIRVSHLGEVEVVVPRGFDRHRIPDILAKRQDWIAKTTERIAAERRMASDVVPEQSQPILPERLELRALLETWTVQYQSALSPHVAVTGHRTLTVEGAMEATPRLLSGWLIRKAEDHLTPWLRQVSQDLALPCSQISVRGQKTLWASCSSRKNISLNYKLLFVPPRLVRYVFVHELCHTIHLNHSAHFWALVAQKEPDYKLLDSELNKSWPYIPEWVERASR